jgi:phage shock protein E
MNLKNMIFIAVPAIAAGVLVIYNGNAGSQSLAEEWIKRGAVVVDVRTIEEYAEWHFDGSENIPLAELEDKIHLFGDKENSIVVYCRKGNRSGRAKTILERHGYKNVLNGGGLEEMRLLKR